MGWKLIEEHQTRLRARLPDRVLLPGQGLVPIVQHPAHGGDAGASHRSRLAGPAGAAVGPGGAQGPAHFLHRDADLKGAALRLFPRA